MKIDLNKLKRSGKTEENFFFEYEPKESLSNIPNAEVTLPVKISGNVTLTGERKAYVSGEVAFTLSGECTRCLNKAENTYVVEFGENVEPDSVDGYSTVSDVIDLSKIVDDVIVMNMPVAFLCKDDCKGLCPTCGQNLNDGACKCNK